MQTKIWLELQERLNNLQKEINVLTLSGLALLQIHTFLSIATNNSLYLFKSILWLFKMHQLLIFQLWCNLKAKQSNSYILSKVLWGKKNHYGCKVANKFCRIWSIQYIQQEHSLHFSTKTDTHWFFSSSYPLLSYCKLLGPRNGGGGIYP